MLELRRLRNFGTRSLLIHGLMGASFLGALGSAFFVSGEVGLVSFVAFVNFTAGLWVAHSIHSLGNSFTDDEYEGITGEL